MLSISGGTCAAAFDLNTIIFLTAVLLHFGQRRVVMIFTGRFSMLQQAP